MEYTHSVYHPQPFAEDGTATPSRLLDFRSAAQEYGLTETFLRRLRAERRIPVVRVRGRIFLERPVMDALIEAGREPATADPAVST